jgi:hypothetical protein
MDRVRFFMVWAIGLLVCFLAVVTVMVLRGPDLAAEFHKMLAAETASDAARPHPLVTEASIAGLPAPVQRYIRLSGAIGKPRPASLTVTYDAQMFAKPGAAAMTGIAVQYDRFDPPKRLFFMPSQMYGLPVKVLHDYDGTAATMRVRLAALINVVDAHGEAFSRAETVTLLNDLCLFAPGWLSDPRLIWSAVDDRSAHVIFRNGPHTVTATLFFNDADELVNFTSRDRGAIDFTGQITRKPWSTPVRDYKSFAGQRLLSQGEAVWNDPAGDFTYGKFTVTGFETH